MTRFREVGGVALLILALLVIGKAVFELHWHDYVSAIVLVVVGLSLLGAALELLRPSMAE